ncbi:MAG: pyridoxal phosphate-dependent aminotransferase [Aureliella sp.]
MRRLGPSERLQQVQQPVIPLVSQWTRETEGTLSLAQGVVSYAPPQCLQDVLAKAHPNDQDICRYGPAEGADHLRQQIAEKLRSENQIDLDQASIVCTAGSNMAFFAAVFCVASVGDQVILVRPYYFNHQMAIEIAGCECRFADCLPNHQLDVSAIEQAITPRTRAIVTISPNNPTGAVYCKSDLIEVNQLCERHGIVHIHDEAYEYFTFGQKEHFSPASIPGAAAHTISLFSLSKAYAMAGWRFGYAVVPQQLELAIKKVQDTNLISVPGITQRAAMAALLEGRSWCRKRIAGIEESRQLALAFSAEASGSWRFSKPDGGFYLLATLDQDLDDVQVCRGMIEQHKIAVLPGSTFGIHDRCTLRISFGGIAGNDLEAALQRLKCGLEWAEANSDKLARDAT